MVPSEDKHAFLPPPVYPIDQDLVKFSEIPALRRDWDKHYDEGKKIMREFNSALASSIKIDKDMGERTWLAIISDVLLTIPCIIRDHDWGPEKSETETRLGGLGSASRGGQTKLHGYLVSRCANASKYVYNVLSNN